MQRALLTGIVVAITCSMIGLFLVLKRYSLFGDALSHVAFGGIALGFFLNIYPIWTAFAVSVSTALGITKLRKSTKISGDAAIAVLLSSGFAMGVLLISASHGFTIDLFSFLFGSILLTNVQDTLLIVAVSCGVIATLIAIRKPLIHFTFDEEQAKVHGIPIEKLNYLFVALAAVTVIATMRLVGILLISALIVLPNITSILMGKGFKKTILISISISVTAVIVGITISYYFNLAPAGTIVMLMVAMFVGTLAAKHAGLFSKNVLQEENNPLTNH
ncbi:MAG: zinc ABC transporter permease [Thaumarchaeota archaeon 13_1_40CM_38_12]|nr:MAG: zinc ABC transporter permease [Thaumarchaeota archaeon 13_1_40CM_38_12]OLD30594.1 MAG: zinc ABC transporter permease [Thaumarchaeota archaeon 13_1_40CM_2_39_7]TLY03378.1 MAG: metal ABC transporter permease [Nitrososphaerota archaeon]TLY09287.1 MAG: metal ABC transporter permease [Nitrososphaerota archaeon]